MAQAAAPATRGSVENSWNGPATPPAVCQSFKAFCDCVACYAADSGENCALCAAGAP